jgi:hypothetical protein
MEDPNHEAQHERKFRTTDGLSDVNGPFQSFTLHRARPLPHLPRDVRIRQSHQDKEESRFAHRDSDARLGDGTTRPHNVHARLARLTVTLS